MLSSIPDPLRILIALGLTGLLVMLRLEAQRFGAAEYDEPVDGRPPSITRRLAWYLVGFSLVAGIVMVLAIWAFRTATAGRQVWDRDVWA